MTTYYIIEKSNDGVNWEDALGCLSKSETIIIQMLGQCREANPNLSFRVVRVSRDVIYA